MPISRSEVRDAWSRWLGNQEVHFFLTITQDMAGVLQRGKPKLLTDESRVWSTPRKAHPEQMVKRFYLLRELFNRAYLGRDWRKRDGLALAGFVGLERHASHSAHAHACLRFSKTITDGERLHWQEVFTQTGGICRLEFPRGQHEVVEYVTKYVLKHGDIIMTPNFVPLPPEQPLVPFARSG